ncbi:MAG: hypothetical protein NTX97_01830 [Bacteroidetes bacterium]|nr:hypothetical protein [Bacteroidota bacterium]
MKNKFLILLFLLPFSGKIFGQGTPQEFSKAFINSLLNYNEEKLKKLISSDPKEQTEILEKLKEIYSNDLKPLKGSLLSSSTRAVLKDGDEKYKEKADIFVTITDNKKIKYELKLWGCNNLEGKWLLGNKIELNKL